jgi:hypothetical protein
VLEEALRYDPTGHDVAVVAKVVVGLAVVLEVVAFEVDVVVVLVVDGVVVEVVAAAEVVDLLVVLVAVDSLKLVVVCCAVTDTHRNNSVYSNLFIVVYLGYNVSYILIALLFSRISFRSVSSRIAKLPHLLSLFLLLFCFFEVIGKFECKNSITSSSDSIGHNTSLLPLVCISNLGRISEPSSHKCCPCSIKLSAFGCVFDHMGLCASPCCNETQCV